MPFVDSKGFNRKIGSGHESDVFVHDKKDYVYKQRYESDQVYEWESSPNYIKAEFYLTKLAHLLFPNNVPDLAAADRFSQIQQKQDIKNPEINKEETQELRYKLKSVLGVDIDRNPANFVKTNNQIVYLDRLSPWWVYQPENKNESKKIWFRFLEQEKMKDVIQNIFDTKKRRQAEKYVNSLFLFLSAEQKRLGNIPVAPFPYTLNRPALEN